MNIKTEKKSFEDHTYTFIHIDTDTYKLTLCDYGASLYALETKDREGNFDNIVFSPDIDFLHTNYKFAGNTIAPYAGRITPNRLPLKNDTYFPKPQSEDILLHSGDHNLSKEHYNILIEGNQIIFSINPKPSKHYPMPKTIQIIYTVEEETFEISFYAMTEQEALVNMTNHAYYNLNGFKDTIADHHLYIETDSVVFVDQYNRPVHIESLEDTIYDFRHTKPLAPIFEDLEMTPQKGLDHPFILKEGKISLHHQGTGRILHLETDYDVVVVYTNNFPYAMQTKEGHMDEQHLSICLECQHLPNDLHLLSKPKSILPKYSESSYSIRYRFEVLKWFISMKN